MNPLYDALFAGLAGRQTRLMVLADGSEITGAAFHAMLAQAGAVLRDCGVVKGDRVAVQVGKSPEALALYGATVAIGAVFLPLNPAYTASEVGYFLSDATPRVFIADAGKAEVAAAQAVPLRTMAEVVALMVGAGGAMVVEPCTEGDLAAILYTSGTTGRPKGAMLTHGNLLSNARVLAELWQFTDQDVLLHALPIFHTHGLFVASHVSLLTGGAMIFLPGFDAAQVVRWLPAATVMMGVPTFYTRLLGETGFDRDLAAHMRLFVSGSAPLLADTHVQFEERSGHRILERYGMTETNMNTSNPYDGDRRAGTVGLPLPGVALRLVDGVIEVKGPNVFAGYWRMPEKTAEELRPDGWFITGDLGQIDADGYVSIIGRAKDLVITGGYNVYPKEVELALDAVPGVTESAVIGVPHPDFGEAVFAVLVGSVTPDMALAAVGDDLARFKQPKAAVVVAELPRNTMGKVQKNVLRDTYKAWFAESREGG